MLRDIHIRLRALFRRERVEAELDEELRFHLEHETEKYVQSGMNREKAARQARIKLGGMEQTKEEARDARGVSFIETTIRHMRYGLRQLRRSPGFTVVAILTLALGIGASATVFSWVRGVLLDPLPGIPRANQLVTVETVMPNGALHTSSYPDFQDFRRENRVFSGMVGFELIPVDMSWRRARGDRRVWGEIVTENYFQVLDVHAERGHLFQPRDAERGLGGDPYIVLSHNFWERQFGGSADILGRPIEVNRHEFTVIGIAPADFQGTIGGIAPDYWVPMMMQPAALPGENLQERAPTFVHIIGRLKPGVSVAQAQADMASLARNIAHAYPATSYKVGVSVHPIWKASYGVQQDLLSPLLFLSALALLVLLIGCANIANLLLARSTNRGREMGVRAAMGATSAVLMRQLLVESVMLSLAAGIVGVWMASALSGMLLSFLPREYLPIGLPLGVNGEVLAFTLAIAVTAGVVSGLMPALRASRPDVNEALKEGGRANSPGARGRRMRSLLVVSEIGLALILATAAGLLLRSMRKVQAASPGFDPHHVLIAAFDLRGNGYAADGAQRFYEKLMSWLRALPGVESVSSEQWVPLWFYGRGLTVPVIEGYTPRPHEDMQTDYNVVGPDYFHTMKIPIVAGRGFTTADRAGQPFVAIVNQTMAKRFWPGESPLGHRLLHGRHWYTVVGVAHNIKYHSITERPESFLYFPELQDGATDTNILVRTKKDPEALLPTVRMEARAIDPSVSVLQEGSLEGIFHLSLFAYRTAATLALVMGTLGLLLAALGIYGVLSYSVNQQTHEIGIRLALGANPQGMLRMVVLEGVRLALVGIAVGFAVALALTRLMTSLLYGVSPYDPVSFIVVICVILATTLLSCYIPARRAMRVHPAVALRHE